MMSCHEWEPINKEEWRDIWVFIEVWQNIIKEASLQLLSKARELADKLNERVVALMIGRDLRELSKEPIYYGADKVILVEHEVYARRDPEQYAHVMLTLIKKYKPNIFLIAGTRFGRELSGRVATAANAGVTADCTDFRVEKDTRDLIQIRPAFGGKTLAHIRTPRHRPQMATARPNVFPMPNRDEKRRGEIINENIEPIRSRTRVIKFIPAKVEKAIPIEKAKVIISGGFGLQNAKNFKMLWELADLIKGATVGASRKAVDSGWMPRSRQVGQTGKTVTPYLYVAIGISGAIQHLAGMSKSKYVIAINKDRHAPIFRASDFGVIGDLFEIVPKLINELKRIKETKTIK